jgi:hypothetical protein
VIDHIVRDTVVNKIGMLLGLAATIGRKRVRARAVPAAVRLHHRRLPR